VTVGSLPEVRAVGAKDLSVSGVNRNTPLTRARPTIGVIDPQYDERGPVSSVCRSVTVAPASSARVRGFGATRTRAPRTLELFRGSETITSRDVQTLFGVSRRTARMLLAAWVRSGFLTVADPAKKSRKYRLAI